MKLSPEAQQGLIDARDISEYIGRILIGGGVTWLLLIRFVLEALEKEILPCCVT